MFNWQYKSEQYEEKNFKPIDEGDYRVRITNVKPTTSRAGMPGLEIALDVSGKNNKLWHHIWFDSLNERITNQRLGEFFNSFNIQGNDQRSCDAWIGKMGAVRVKHCEYEGRLLARVAFCLSRNQHWKLPEWQEPPATQQSSTSYFDNEYRAPAPVNTPTRSFDGFSF